MNTNQTAVKSVVQIVPDAGMAPARKLMVGIEQAKWNLAAEYKLALPDRLFRMAVNEAEAIARETEYPQLFFPTLAREKIKAISAWCIYGETLHGNYDLAV